MINIYKISSKLTNLVYIGSTNRKLNQRLSEHKSDYKKCFNNETHNTTSFDIIKLGECKIQLLEICEIENRNERERWYIENTENVINKNLPGRTMVEWCNDNKNYYKTHFIEYYKTHKEQYSKYGLEYRETHKEKIKEKFICQCGGKYTHQNKTIHLKSKKHNTYLDYKKQNAEN
jgi:hypothetical protein